MAFADTPLIPHPMFQDDATPRVLDLLGPKQIFIRQAKQPTIIVGRNLIAHETARKDLKLGAIKQAGYVIAGRRSIDISHGQKARAVVEVIQFIDHGKKIFGVISELSEFDDVLSERVMRFAPGGGIKLWSSSARGGVWSSSAINDCS